jgi:serine protease Do
MFMKHSTKVIFIALSLAFSSGHTAYTQSSLPSFADLAENLSPTVVNISTSQKIERPPVAIPQLPPGSPFGELFKDFFEQLEQTGPQTVQSLGSGFVIDLVGYIVTNNHVIDGADEIVVNFSNGNSLPATVVGHDPKTDIALLKVETTEPLKFAEFGDSENTRVGDWVLAIGNPFGLGGSVSAGIISARNRNINAGSYDDFIQTDAAINRGNSGGPLFDTNGKVIGVNTAIISPTGGSIGIGFAVPSSIAQNVISQLREFGETRRGWLGVKIQDVTEDIAEGLGLDKKQGALVAGVTAGGPAEEAGVQSGDIITKFDGKDIIEMRDLPRMVAETEVNKNVRIVVWRKGETQTLKVTLGRLENAVEDMNSGQVSVAPTQSKNEQSVLGIFMQTLGEQERIALNIPDDVQGVIISDVERGSQAAAKGIRQGDIIAEVSQTPVQKPADVKSLIEKAKEDGKKSVLLTLYSQGETRFVAIRTE